MQLPSRLKNRLFYGWVVVVTFFIAGTALWGVRFSFGIFFKSIESEFNLTRTATSSVLSLYMLLGGAFAVLGGWALDKYGPRVVILLMGLFTGISLLLTSQTSSLWQLFITYSLLLTMGTSAMFVVTMSTVSRWFDKKRGLALGITGAGAGVGTIIMAPFATYLISNLDWRMAYLVIGVIVWFVVIPLSRLLKKDPYEIGALPDGVKSDLRDVKNEEASLQAVDLSLSQAFSTRSFWFLIFVFLLFASSVFLVLTHLVPHVTDMGFSAEEAAGVFSLLGGTAVAGRVIMGMASDRIGKKLTVIICALLQAGAMVWLIWSQDLWMFYIFALVFGFAYGGSAPGMVALVGDTFGLGQMGAILGVVDMGFGVGAAIGPAVGGLIFDINHSYSLAFLLGAVGMLIDALLTALVRRETNRNFEDGRSR